MKKKLLFVINTMGRAGAETALIELLKKLDSLNKYELSLYAVIPCGELFARVPENVRILNKSVNNGSLNSVTGRITIAREILFSFFYRFTGLKAIGYMIRNIREQKASGRKLQYDKLLWRLLADGRPVSEEEYDLAVAYIEGAAVYYLADKVNAKHKAAFIHIDYQKAGYTPFMDKDCYSGMDNIFVVSKEVGEKFCSVYPQYRKKVRLFRNLLDQQSIREKAVNGTGFTDGFPGIRFVTVGRLHYQKGYDIVIEVLAKLREEGFNIRWYVIGEGAERRNLEMLTKKYGVEEYFILMGAKDNPYPYIKQADIYVHATRFEGKSIAIEEAQILGKTIVASDCTGNREQIESGYDGILVELSVEKLVRELKRILKEPELQKEYAKHVMEKQLDYPEDLEFMLAIMNEEKRR